MPPSEKMKLVDMRSSEISIAHQCRLLNLSRSRLYYTPKGIPSDELAMMRLLDEFYIGERGIRTLGDIFPVSIFITHLYPVSY